MNSLNIFDVKLYQDMTSYGSYSISPHSQLAVYVEKMFLFVWWEQSVLLYNQDICLSWLTHFIFHRMWWSVGFR